MIDWDEVKREDAQADAKDDLISSNVKCDNCGEKIKGVYYDIDTAIICKECINDFKYYI